MAGHPRWVDSILKAQNLPENKDQNVYQIATVDSHNVPHVRSHIHRNLLFPKGYPKLPILLTTTDIRSPKVTQILSNPTVEICWWMDGSQDQFRILGRASIIPAPEHPFHAMVNLPHGSSLVKLTQSGEENQKEEGKYDWEKKRREAFDDTGRHLRASWCTPTPGTVLKSYDDTKAWPSVLPKLDEAETKEDKKNVAIALGNFALIVIEPTEIDWVQITPNRRTKFTRKETLGDGDEWMEEILVP